MKFRIGFDSSDKEKLFQYWDEILENHVWSYSEGKFLRMFEEKWSEYVGASAVAVSNWSRAAEIILQYYGVGKGSVVACPSNTFMATPLSILHADARVQFIDCNRYDLCLSFEHLKEQAREQKPDAVYVVHIGGHIAFEIEKIAQWCKENDIILIEDCAQAHGAQWNGKKAGTWGDVGIYSFYSTKTISTGEGSMIVSHNRALIDYVREYRDYGKPEYRISGQNARLSEFAAALGCVEVDRLPDIVEWKNEYAEKHLDPRFWSSKLNLPAGMTSGLYKYIVFEQIENSTGRVYDQPCHRILTFEDTVRLPNTDWVSKNHSCVPLFYKGAEL